MEYLAELIKERKQLEMFPTIFPNVDRLVDDGKPFENLGNIAMASFFISFSKVYLSEITRVRVALFQCEFMTDEIKLPEPMGEIVTITEKLYVPKKEHPDVRLIVWLDWSCLCLSVVSAFCMFLYPGTHYGGGRMGGLVRVIANCFSGYRRDTDSLGWNHHCLTQILPRCWCLFGY